MISVARSMESPGSPRYSICITNFNDRPTLQASLDSILNQVDERFELIVVDNRSTDGSKEILEKYAKSGKIGKLIEKKCSRGRGKQISVENASGQYIVADLDMDDEFDPKLSDLVAFYHRDCEGKLLAAVGDLTVDWSTNVTIGPRSLIQELGGWPDLQVWEDSNLWGRAARENKYLWTAFAIARKVTAHPERKKGIGRLKFAYIRYRESMRQGRRVFSRGEKMGYFQTAAFLLAKISLPFYKSYRSTSYVNFQPRGPSYFIEYRGGH